MKWLSLFVTLILSCTLFGQSPQVFDVANVGVGAKRIPTLIFHAVGKWSDTEKPDSVSVLSTDLMCYKAFAFCDEASARIESPSTQVFALHERFDIVRWNASELVAIDDEPYDIITLRVDFHAKSVSLNRAPTAEGIRGGEKATTSFLQGLKEEQERVQQQAKELAEKEKRK